MSLGLKIGLGAFLACFAISLIIAVPLQTAGYDTHVIKNEALVATECRVLEQIVSPDTCYRPCNCITVCMPKCTTSTVNMHTTTKCNQECNQQCQTCPYSCFSAVWLVEYSLIDPFGKPVKMMGMGNNDVGMNSTDMMGGGLTYKLNTPTAHFDTMGLAQGELNARPIGSVFVCYYDSSNLGDVRLEKYDLGGFYASYIVFYIFAGIAALGAIIIGVFILFKS
jgi:hypothetical protein